MVKNIDKLELSGKKYIYLKIETIFNWQISTVFVAFAFYDISCQNVLVLWGHYKMRKKSQIKRGKNNLEQIHKKLFTQNNHLKGLRDAEHIGRKERKESLLLRLVFGEN